MFVLRKLFKIVLLPLVFVLFFIKWFLSTSLKLTESIVGLFTIFGVPVLCIILSAKDGRMYFSCL